VDAPVLPSNMGSTYTLHCTAPGAPGITGGEGRVVRLRIVDLCVMHKVVWVYEVFQRIGSLHSCIDLLSG
jgi:hypothetical protein